MTPKATAGSCFALAALLAPLALAEPAAAFCGTFGHGPCTPSFCSTFRHGPCIPQYPFPLGQDLQLTIDTSTPPPGTPEGDVDTLSGLFKALRACWTPPKEDEARSGMQVSVRFSFKRNGDVFGSPRWTYTTPDAPDDARKLYRDAITSSIARCTPLHLTKGLGGAIAGRPIAVRFVENRDLPRRESGP